MGRKETEEAIADSRAGRVSGRFATVGELLADLNADDTPAIHEGSTNVYADLGYPDAAENKVMLCEPGYWRSESMTISAINAKG